MPGQRTPRRRDLDLERRLLAQAEHAEAAHGFAAHVADRMARARVPRPWWSYTVCELAHELAQEALDIGGWGVLAYQAIRDQQARRHITQAMRHGAAAYRALAALHRRLEELHEP